MAFNGWPREAFDVLARLEGDPPLSVREEVRADRERLVRVPMIQLLDELADRDPSYADHAVWHYGKTAWWWQNQSSSIRIDRNIEIGVGLGFEGMTMQGAWWYGSTEQRERFRAAVAGRSGARLQRIVDDLVERGYEIKGDRMKRVPKGYPADHPRADLLRHRSLIAARHLGFDDWLFGAEALDRVEQVGAELRPLLEWLADKVVAES
ncbi:DUF2461 family protein [Microlunatus soli]|uniref:TIGR02453 family protein n=1 Tax=Microlunatus soli TaxID=630515 RepID=A0A1H1TDR1_9ACTN|nr:DUF2461 family protein [Microlunatus soli]SDS58264.1 Conserved hypothetical protein [Microlunatus soli]